MLVLGAGACGDIDSPAKPPSLVATVRQFGPVGYRDPLGAISPDGRWLATAAHHVLRIQPLPEGTVRTLPAGNARVVHLAWTGDGHLIAAQPDSGLTWWRYEPAAGTRTPIWPRDSILRGRGGTTADPSSLRELSWSPDGRAAGIQLTPGGSTLWVLDSLGRALESRSFEVRLGYPAWLPDGRIACLALRNTHQRVTLPCGEQIPAGLESKEAYGPMAASPDGRTLYLSIPNDSGFLALWAWSLATGTGRQLASFARDTYAPSVSSDGTVLFKEQDYHTEVRVLPSEGGTADLRTAFQAETPSWDPSGTRLGITYGTWRRVIDDFRYPDIAQEAGIVSADGPPSARPDEIVQDSPSEDQGLAWSPNRRWIAFHSHQQNSDDIWLRPADASAPPSRITWLGRGAEVGWPRWSPDGRWIVFNGDSLLAGRRRSLLWIVGVDQATGSITVPARPIPLPGLEDDVGHAEWVRSSDAIVFQGVRPGGHHAIYRVRRSGGTPELLHRYQSPQTVDGFGLSPDGAWLVFPEPDRNGRLQLFQLATAPGSRPGQLTSDSVDKTQPAVSPDGRRIAFTAWRYQARFWTVAP